MEILEFAFVASGVVFCVCAAVFLLGFTSWFIKELIKDFF